MEMSKQSGEINIDQRDIKKGSLPEILPKFYPNSISYLSELNEYRMYAEVWSNKRSKEWKRRSEIGQEGYLKTLEFGEEKKRRKTDKVRFDYFVVANSVNYIAKGKKPYVHIQMGGIQTNSIINEIIESERRILKKQPDYPSSAFHSKEYLPETLDMKLDELELHPDKKTNKYYFEIHTNTTDFSNPFQKIILEQVLGKEAFSEKMQLLHKVGRKYIRCFFEKPENVKKNTDTPNVISRLCVAGPFLETIVFDFAGTLEDYSDACLLGTLIKEKEEKVERNETATEDPTEEEGWLDDPKIDSYI
jgi:hypothetical protein